MVQKKPVQLSGPEHFCEVPGPRHQKDGWNQRICSSAPIFDQTGKLIGTISIGNTN
jgi:transcriptional regulator of acetoin/glycerol metabolism